MPIPFVDIEDAGFMGPGASTAGVDWALAGAKTAEIAAGPLIPASVRLVIDPATSTGTPVEVLLLPGRALVFGRDAGSDVRVDDPTVSGRHCRVSHAGSTVEVTDLGARNGVCVAGLRVSHAVLPVGSAWEIGRTVVRVEAATRRSDREAAPLSGLVGNAPPMRALSASVRRIAGLRLPVLLRGESGTGKDLVARAIHDEGPRARRPFVVINAATISRELAESELFGHQRGAFTGASRDRRGAFREAQGGTLFLDEIGSVPLEVQAKLLRVVEEGVVRPLGAEATLPVDVRLVVATCEPLEAMVADRGFRADLYERLAVCVVHVPCLRDRRDDIPALARHLLNVSDLANRTLSRDALAVLRTQKWPGNVRELRNVVVQAALNAGATIHAEDVAAVLSERSSRPVRVLPCDAVRIFEESGHNVSAAARRAGLPRTTMRDLLRSAGVPPGSRPLRTGTEP